MLHRFILFCFTLSCLFLVTVFTFKPITHAETLNLTLSDTVVRITSNFTGEQITLFGAIEADAFTAPRGKPYDIVITVSGPARPVVARLKEHVAGIWINRSSQTFPNLPAFFAVMSTRPVEEIAIKRVRERLFLTPETAMVPTLSAITGAQKDRVDRFTQALLRLKEKERLYITKSAGVQMIGKNLFKARLPLTATAPVGNYEVYAHLFSDNALLTTRFARFRVEKTGFGQYAFDMAQKQAPLYGLLVVLLAILTGWIGGIVFKRE